MTYTFSTGSGFLNSPPRVVLIGDDNRPGSYPVEVSPVLAAKSTEYAKPYRDDIFPDTRSPYAQASVVFAAVPNESESITLTNAQGQAHTFTFKLTSPNFATGPTSYDISYTADGGLSATPREGDEGLTRSQVITKRALEKFVQAVNAATGSLITASPTSYYNRAILTQRIPGTAGNTANSTTSADVTIQSFTGGNAGEIRYPFGIIASGSGEVLRRVLSTAESGTLDVPAAGKASLLNAYSDGHPYAVFQPYDESNAQQAFGIGTGGSSEYGTQTQLYDEFFTRGSTLGNLDEPLSAKDKIVIDLSPIESTTLQYQNVVGQNYPMAYWNFEKRVWERIGFGTRPQSAANLETEFRSYMLGFGQGWENAISTASLVDFSSDDPSILAEFDSSKSIFRETGWNSCTDTFGFPSHAKFHATSSQYLDASTIIDRPFLVEKFVYEFSGSSSGPAELAVVGASSFFHNGGGTFFILNQRKSNPVGSDEDYTKINVAVSSSGGTANAFLPPYSSSVNSKQLVYGIGPIPAVTNVSSGGPALFIDDVRDLITYARVGSIFEGYSDYVKESLVKNTSHPADFMDLAIDVPYGQNLGGKYALSANIKSPCYSPSNSIFETWTIELNKSRTGASPSTNQNAVYLSKESSTRNSIDVPTGRSIYAEFAASKLEYSTKAYPVILTATPPSRQRVFGIEKDSVDNPYLILPGDKLIFGWQSILSYGYSISGPSLTLKPGAGKLTLYGSYLQDDKPVHDIYKDQLNSDAAHEALPTGPWVLDRFETEPQMCYSGSMREQYVVGTMLTKNGSSISITDVNDQSGVWVPYAPNPGYTVKDFGVRRVVRRVSDGYPVLNNIPPGPLEVYPWRYSFNRNFRLQDPEEQYYDSMQPDPIGILFKPSNVRAGVIVGVGGYLTLMLPGENCIFTPDAGVQAALNQYSNRKFIGSFPFESFYSGIARVKKINSKTLRARRVPTWTDAGATITLGTGFIDYGPSFVTGVIGSGATSQSSNFARPGGVYPDARGLEDNGWTYIPNLSSWGDTNPARGAVVPGYGLFRDEATDPIDDINYYASRFLGCFGDGYLGIIQSTGDIDFGPGAFYWGTFFGFTTNYDVTFFMKYRGAKHGLVNPTPLFSSAIFNGTHYGQFRDMMEQRQYTRFSLSDNTLTDAAVSVQFINRAAPPGTLNIVSGSATNSSNISKFATSEHPYDDALSSAGQIWDRDTALPETFIAL